MRISHAEQAVPELLADRKYALGLEAGVILKNFITYLRPQARKYGAGAFAARRCAR